MVGRPGMTDPSPDPQAGALLAPDEPPAVEIINGAGRGTAVLLCDHASRRVPSRLGGLGLDPAALSQHIAWDPGAAAVARRLSARLDAPLVLSGYSRLVIDLNRPLHSPESIPEQSAGVRIPGNQRVSAEQRATRIHALFRPYHDAIGRLLDGRSNRATALLSIHSFTPVLNGEARPWHVGISHWRDPRLAALLLEALRHDRDLTVGNNEPYPIEEDIDYTILFHGDGRGLPSVMIEMRQDGLGSPDAAAAWALRIAEAYRSIEPEVLRLFEHGHPPYCA